MNIAKICLFACSISLFGLTTEAQKVVRKGVTPVKTVKKESRAPYYSLEQLSGKWVEYQRLLVDSKEKISFDDSLLLDFNKRDSVHIRQGKNMSLVGQVAINKPNELMLAGDIYTITRLNGNIMVLNDGSWLRYFRKTKAFYFDNYGNKKVPAEEYKMPVKASLNMLPGDWDIYRRQAAPGYITEHESQLIKRLYIPQLDENGSATGTISFFEATETERTPCTIKVAGSAMHVEAGTNSWDFNIYKASGSEFIFGKPGGLMYFAKKL